MFAIIKTGGKQYKVSEGNFFDVEKIDVEKSSKVILTDVLFIQDKDGNCKFGNPSLSGVEVECEVLDQFRDDKVIIFKKRRRKNSRRKNGHRQSKTKLKVLSIKIK